MVRLRLVTLGGSQKVIDSVLSLGLLILVCIFVGCWKRNETE